jgi:hypothetical protein
MGKMKSGWDFLPEHGFHGSAAKGMTHVSGYSRSKPKFAKGGAVKGPTDAKTGKGFAAAKIPTPQVGKKGPDLNIKAAGNHLAFAKGGAVSEDSEPNESQAGFSHGDPETHQHLEARRGGRIHKAKGGPVHNHFRQGHKIESHPDGFGVHHPKAGHPYKHHAPPHKKEGHKAYFAGGGIARPTGMPRAPVLGMKRIRHAPGMPGSGKSMGRPAPGIPGMPQQGTAAMGQQPMKPRGMGGSMGTMVGRPMLSKGGRC